MAKKLTITAYNLHLLSSLPTTLEYLNCNSNSNLTSLPDLPPGLTHLSCSNNNLSSLPPLPSGLTSLYCNYNNLSSLPPLPSGLTSLYCSHSDLTSLPDLPSTLEKLYCINNSLTSLPLLPLGLKELYCCGNKLPDWYDTSSIDEIREKQIIERLLLVRKKIASRIIQKVWTKYWYYPNEEGISRYSSYMSRVDCN